MLPDEQFKPYLKWSKPCACGKPSANATVRLFRAPFAPLAADGMPSQAWVWSCNAIIEDGIATIEAALSVPPVGSIRPMLQLARELGCSALRWERVDTLGNVRVFPYNLT